MIAAEVLQLTVGALVTCWAGNRANEHVLGTPWMDRIAISVLLAAGLLAVVGVPLSRLPVVIDARAEVVEHTPGLARLRVTAVKPQSQGRCDFLGLDAYVMDTAGAMINAEAGAFRRKTRPPGLQDFGVLSAAYPPEREAMNALFVAHHQCAWFMPQTRTTLGPFGLPPAQ